MLHRYYLTQRPVSIGTQPKGFFSFSDDPGELPNGITYYGYVDYDRDLTDKEVKEYELYDGGKNSQLSMAERHDYSGLENIL